MRNVLPLLPLFAAASLFAAEPPKAPDAPSTEKPDVAAGILDEAKRAEWLSRWEKDITGETRNRYCDKVMGEDVAWLLGHLLKGFAHGYAATHDPKWIAMLVDWTDSWIKRGVKEPDGFIGWPHAQAAGTPVDNLDSFTADSMLGEAMAWQPVMVITGEILKDPALKAKYGEKAEGYLKLAEQCVEKWEKRGGWRETKDGGMISVVLPYGLDAKTGQWLEGYEARNEPGNGFSHPDNKANAVADWLLAMSDVTHQEKYKQRAERWFKVMKSRMKLQANGTYKIWNYWEPAGPWDYKPDGSTKHWVGVHPNPGYYAMDVGSIVNAFRHGMVFTQEDIGHLVSTAIAENRNWSALAPFDETLRKRFLESIKLGSWGAVTEIPDALQLSR